MESTAISPSLGAPLRTRIRSVRSRQLQVDVATGVARLLIVLIFLVCAGMVWDWLVDLDFQVRALLLGVYAVAALWLVWTGILRPFTRMPSEDEVALMIERGFPDYRTRLIASVQLSRGTQQAGTSTALVRALVAETENLTRARDLRAIISMEMLATLAAFAIVLLAAVGGVIATMPNGLDFLKRTVQFAQEYPYDTRLPDSMEDISVARGDPVDHYVTARGVLPDTGQLLIYTDASQSGNAEVLIMKRLGQATDSSAGYMVQKEDAQQSYNYTIKINDGIVSGRVNVLPRPIIKNLAAEIHSPGYTGEPLRPVDLGTSQLGPVLAGSRVRLRITASKPIRRAELWLHREGNEVSRELVREFKKGEEQSSFHIDFNPGLADPRYLAFHIKLLDHRGINSRDELRYGFSVQPDDPPVLALRTPADEDEVTAQARPVVGGLAKDNYGLSQLQLHYRVTLPADAEPMEGSIDFIEQHTRRLSGEFKALAEGNHTRLPAIQDAAKQAQEAALSSENRAGLLSDAARKLDQAVAELERIKNKKPGVDQVAWQLADATSRIAADLASRAKLEGASVQLPVSIPLDFQKHLPGLAGLPLPARGQDPLTVSYWLEGRDNNTATTTEPIKSNTRTFVIVSSAQKKADLLKRMNQLIVKVEKTKEDQEELKRLTERFTGLRD